MQELSKLIGNTPIIRINYRYKNKLKSVYAKLEYYNFTGSIKDRMIYYIIKKAKEENKLKEGQVLVEATSGNTGISLSAIGKFYGHETQIFMPEWLSEERKGILKLYGAKLSLVSKEEGGFEVSIKKAKDFAENNNGFFIDQFNNKNNVLAYYYGLSREIKNEVGKIDGFVSGIGTGGTLMGVGKYLKEVNHTTKLYALEPSQMPLLKYGDKNKEFHDIEGIGDEFIPSLVDRSMIDDVILVDDQDAINMSRKIAQKFGIGVGISSGANLIASIIANKNDGENIVTVFVDDNKKYISTKLSNDIEYDENFISNQVELVNFETI